MCQRLQHPAIVLDTALTMLDKARENGMYGGGGCWLDFRS